MRRLRRWLDRLHHDTRGTSLTEFVIALPLFFVFFVGVMELGELARSTVPAAEKSLLRTYDKFLEVQSSDSSNFGQVVQQVGHGNMSSHLNPATAGADAANQVRQYPPRHDSRAIQAVISAYEANTYRKLAHSGHLGESAARLEPTTYSGRYSPLGVKKMLSAPEPSLFGNQPSGSVLAFDLFSDRLSRPPKGGKCASLLGMLTSRVNSLLSQSGARPMLAAGIRYGTVTGKFEGRYDIAGQKVDVSTHWNALVAPHVFSDDPHLQTAMATYVTRLAMKTCGRAPYSRMLGISRGSGRSSSTILGISRPGTRNRRLPSVQDGFHLKVPDPYPDGNYKEAGFQPPLSYSGKGLIVDYDP